MAAAAMVRTLLGLKDGARRQIIIWDTPEITLGRGAYNDIVVDDDDVSHDHALLFQQEQVFYVEDRSTSNRTLLNREPLAQLHALQTKDVVKIGSLELTFIRTSKDPTSLGLEVVYSSELRSLGSESINQPDPGSTVLSLEAPIVKEIEQLPEFAVGSVGDFGFEPSESGVRIEPDCDESIVHHEVDALFGKIREVAGPSLDVISSETARAKDSNGLSLTLELNGLTPELSNMIKGLFGKVIDLPALQIRIKADELD